MRFWPILLILSFSFSLFATDELKLEVRALDPNADLSELRDSHYQKEYGVPEVKATKPRLVLPSPDDRDFLFTEVGLLPAASEMDDLDRDVVYRRAYRLSAAALVKKYPDLPKKALEALHARLNGN